MSLYLWTMLNNESLISVIAKRLGI
jgi:hypothetical protein